MTTYDSDTAKTYVDLIRKENIDKGRLTRFENAVLRALWEKCLKPEAKSSRDENGRTG